MIDPTVAVIAVLPAAVPTAVPLLVASLLTGATPELEVVQITEASGEVVPSLNVPVAIKICDVPTPIEGFAGVMAMD